MTDSDFESITAGLRTPGGQLGPAEFEAVMRRQIRHAAQAKLALVGGGVRSAEDTEFMQFGTLKMILLAQVRCLGPRWRRRDADRAGVMLPAQA